MKILRKIFKLLAFIIMLPMLYLMVTFLLSQIVVNQDQAKTLEYEIYLSTNGIHLDIVIPVDLIGKELIANLDIGDHDKFVSFGWGDEKFFIETPHWKDLKFTNLISAMFLKSTSLMHVSKYKIKLRKWKRVPLNQKQLNVLIREILNEFAVNFKNEKIWKYPGYRTNDQFYLAKSSYHCFNTCNSWVNRIFKRAELRACLWTPFDFSLLSKY